MSSFNPLDAVYHMEGLGLKSNITSPGNLFYYHRGLDILKPELPVLVLIHGYPQSNFMWRHVVPLLPPEIPLFIPDMPGYGRSQPLEGPHDKRSVGNEILRVLSTLVASKEKLPIIVAGHDRGARVSHRLVVDNNSPNFVITGTILLDIVPTTVQWASFANPIVASFAFHWPLLANVEQATAMIKAYGGAEWAKSGMRRWAGKSEAGIASFEEHNALEIYGEFFDNESVIRASCDDYRAGAYEDIDEEKKDQESGRKLQVPTMLIYSEDYIGKRYDMVKVWSEWIEDKNLLEDVPIGDGCGHFVAEEAPQKTASAISRFYGKFV